MTLGLVTQNDVVKCGDIGSRHHSVTIHVARNCRGIVEAAKQVVVEGCDVGTRDSAVKVGVARFQFHDIHELAPGSGSLVVAQRSLGHIKSAGRSTRKVECAHITCRCLQVIDT